MKKFLTIFLACVLMLCSATFASADSEMVYKADFEGTETVNKSASDVNWNNTNHGKSYTYSDNVWDVTHGIWAASGYNLFITERGLDLEKVTESNNSYLKATIKNPNVAVTTKRLAFDDSFDTVYTVFKFRVPAGATTGFATLTGGTTKDDGVTYSLQKPLLMIHSDGKFYEMDQSHATVHISNGNINPVAYITNKWYTAIIKTSTTGRQAFIYDETGCVIESDAVTATMTGGSGELQSRGNQFTGGNLAIEIDDSKMIKVLSTASPSLVTEDVKADVPATRKMNIELNANSMLDSSLVQVTLKKGSEVVNTNQYEVSFPDPFTIKVNSKGTALLDRSSTYSLEVTYDGTAYDPITFTTEEMHMVTDADLTIDALAADDTVADDDIATLAAGKVKVHLSVTDPLSYPSFSGRMMAVLYTESGHLAWLDYADLSGADFADLNAIFTLPEIPANAQLKVYLFDNENIYAPVCAPVTFGS